MDNEEKNEREETVQIEEEQGKEVEKKRHRRNVRGTSKEV